MGYLAPDAFSKSLGPHRGEFGAEKERRGRLDYRLTVPQVACIRRCSPLVLPLEIPKIASVAVDAGRKFVPRKIVGCYCASERKSWKRL